MYHTEGNGCGGGVAVCWRDTCVALLLFTSLRLWAILWTEVLMKVFSRSISGIWKNNLFA